MPGPVLDAGEKTINKMAMASLVDVTCSGDKKDHD